MTALVLLIACIVLVVGGVVGAFGLWAGLITAGVIAGVLAVLEAVGSQREATSGTAPDTDA